MLATLKWIGTACGIAGAVLLASRTAASPWGYPVFLVGSLAWLAAAWRMAERPLALLNAVWSAINLLGVWRWLIAPIAG